MKVAGITVAVLLALMACAAPTPIPTQTSVPTALFDGVWLGTTSQGEMVEVVVADDVVTRIRFGARLQGDGWSAETEQERPVYAPVSDGGFYVHVGDLTDEWLVEVSATFEADRLEGVLAVTHNHPQGFGAAWAMVAFTATRREPDDTGA